MGNSNFREQSLQVLNKDSVGEFGLSLFLCRSFLAVSYHKCDDSVGEFMEAECDPCDPVSGENFLADIVLKMSSLMIDILMSIVSLGNIEVTGHFS